MNMKSIKFMVFFGILFIKSNGQPTQELDSISFSELTKYMQQVDKKLEEIKKSNEQTERKLLEIQRIQENEMKLTQTTIADIKGIKSCCANTLSNVHDVTESVNSSKKLLQNLSTQCAASAAGNGCEERIDDIIEYIRSSHDNITNLLPDKLDPTKLGLSKSTPARSCSLVLSKENGLYWIDPDGGNPYNAFQAYCDMATDGGGWTLVYSYKFTNFSNFANKSNAVTPRPSWPVHWSPVVAASTTPPINEQSTGAIEFGFWKMIGGELLVKSNLANWLACRPVSGGLVHATNGYVSCRIIKHVGFKKCTNPNAKPLIIFWDAVGPMLRASTGHQFYFWDGSTSSIFPTHDSCGLTSTSPSAGNVANPHGSIYIR